jgi:hypothetical protein
MRSMSMLQLLGGVAVAGAVAAGTTAFTAGTGIANGTSLKSVVYGATSATVEGAALDSLTLASSFSATPNQVDSVVLKLMAEDDSASLDTTNTVTLTVTAGGGNQGATAPTCSHTGTDTWTCTAANTKYWTGITKLDIVVSNV